MPFVSWHYANVFEMTYSSSGDRAEPTKKRNQFPDQLLRHDYSSFARCSIYTFIIIHPRESKISRLSFHPRRAQPMKVISPSSRRDRSIDRRKRGSHRSSACAESTPTSSVCELCASDKGSKERERERVSEREKTSCRRTYTHRCRETRRKGGLRNFPVRAIKYARLRFIGSSSRCVLLLQRARVCSMKVS